MQVAVLFILWLAMVGESLAQSGGLAEARLLSKSSSGQSVLFNIGELDSVKVGDFGVIMRRISEQDKIAIRVIPVASARVIRVSKNRSLWFLFDIKDTTQLILRDSYIVTTETMSLNGRRTLENTRLTVIDNKEDLPGNLANKKEGDKDLLSLRKEDYELVKNTHKLGESWEKDGQLFDANEWVAVDKAGQQKYAKGLWRSPYEKDFAEQKRLETFHKIVVNYLTRVNDPTFNYGDFYFEQTKDYTGEFRQAGVAQTKYQEFLEEEKRKVSKETELYQELLDKGQAWSADYSDEELSDLLNRVGIVYERDRRRTATVRTYNWQSFGSVSFNLLDNENRADSENARKAKLGIEVGAEWFPAARHDDLQKFSLWSSVRYVEDGVSIGNLNARSQEYSLSLGVTWHPFETPFSIDRNVPFIGVGFRTGVTNLSTPSTRDEANYYLLSFPVIVGGLKYSFRSGLGLRVAMSVEKLTLEQTEANREVSSLPTRQDILDGRVNFGLTKFY